MCCAGMCSTGCGSHQSWEADWRTGQMPEGSSGTEAAALPWSREHFRVVPGGKMETERGDEQQHTDSGLSLRPSLEEPPDYFSSYQRSEGLS